MPSDFVKLDEESNDDYMLSFEGHASEAPHPWLPIILEAHQRLLLIDPEYQIDQIKEKFGYLRYYYHSDLPWESSERNSMEQVVEEAERAVKALVNDVRDTREQDKTNLQTWDDEGGKL